MVLLRINKTTYDSMFDDFNKFFEAEEATVIDSGDYPDIVVFDGISYFVNVSRDSDDEIEYFQLVDSDGEIFFEYDWAGAVDSATIVELLEEYNDNSTVDAVAVKTKGATEEVVSNEDAVNKRIVDDFDFLYPNYDSYPDEFKVEVMNKLSKFSDESQSFHNILVSESAENWDEFGEC